MPEGLQAISFTVHERSFLVRLAVRVPGFPQTGTLPINVIPFVFLLAVRMPHEPTAMGHPVGKGQLLLHDSVGVVKYFNTREQVCGAAPVPFAVVPILKFIVQGQWNIVGHPFGWDAVGDSFGLGCLDHGAVFLGTPGGEQGGTDNSGCDETIYRKSGLHGSKKGLS